MAAKKLASFQKNFALRDDTIQNFYRICKAYSAVNFLKWRKQQLVCKKDRTFVSTRVLYKDKFEATYEALEVKMIDICERNNDFEAVKNEMAEM